MESLKPSDQRAKNAILLIRLALGIEVISLLSSGLQCMLLKDLEKGVEFSQTTLAANDSREQVIGILYLIIFIISAVTFI
jgi:hypothetical protein